MLNITMRQVSGQGRIQDFKLGGGALKKLRRAEGGAKIFGVFRVKNHVFTPKNNIFSNLGGGGGGACAGWAPLWIRPWWFSPGSSTNKTDLHDIHLCNANIVKSGVKHHKTNQPLLLLQEYA